MVAPMHTLGRTAAVLLLAGASVACSDPWQIVEPGQPAAFKGQKTFMFDAPRIGDAKVDGGTEDDYVQSGGDIVEFWNRGKDTFLERYPHALTQRLGERGLSIGPGPTISAVIEDITVGELYTVDGNPNYLRTEFTMVVTVSDGDKKSDKVRISQSAHGFATKPVELRFGAVADGLGRLTADFVASRTE